MTSRPDLIVPIRDRRQHKRYLTLKNVAIAVAVAVASFIAVSIYSEVRGPAPNDFGRLVKKRAAPAPVVPVHPTEVVREAPAIDDQASADPTLVEPMTRAQWLGETTTSAAALEPVPAPVSTLRRGDDVVVVGDASGVAIVKQKRRRPVLAGGFGR